jgi:hypothetical protein
VKRSIGSSVEIVVRANDRESAVILDKLLILGAELREFGDRSERSALILEQHYSACRHAGMLIKNLVAPRADLLLLSDAMKNGDPARLPLLISWIAR